MKPWDPMGLQTLTKIKKGLTICSDFHSKFYNFVSVTHNNEYHLQCSNAVWLFKENNFPWELDLRFLLNIDALTDFWYCAAECNSSHDMLNFSNFIGSFGHGLSLRFSTDCVFQLLLKVDRLSCGTLNGITLLVWQHCSRLVVAFLPEKEADLCSVEGLEDPSWAIGGFLVQTTAILFVNFSHLFILFKYSPYSNGDCKLTWNYLPRCSFNSNVGLLFLNTLSHT